MAQITRIGRSRGVTLLELLVVIAIVGILAGIAIPSYRNMMISSRTSNMVSALHSTMLFARAEALKRGVPLVLCKSSNADTVGASCDASGSAGTVGWGSGWLLFIDTDRNNSRDPAEVLIRVQGRLVSNVSEGSIVPSTASEFMVFTATGQVMTPVNFVVTGASGSTDLNRAVCVAMGGRAKTGKAPTCT